MICPVCGESHGGSDHDWCDECRLTPTNRLHERTPPRWLDQVKPPDWLIERVEQDTRGTSISVEWLCTWREGKLLRVILIMDSEIPKDRREQARELGTDEDWHDVARQLGLLA